MMGYNSLYSTRHGFRAETTVGKQHESGLVYAWLENRQTYKNTIFLYKQGLSQNYFTRKKGVNCEKSEYATQNGVNYKMEGEWGRSEQNKTDTHIEATIMEIYILKFTLEWKVNIKQINSHKCYQSSAKLKHYSQATILHRFYPI